MILEKTFFVKKNVNGQTDYLANFFIKAYKINEKTKDGLLDGFLFKKDTISSELDSEMMANLFSLLIGKKGIFSSSSDDRSGIMTLKLICSHEELAVEFINTLYDVLSEYYINNSIEKDLLTYNLLKQKADLLYGQMNSKLDEAISYDDKTLGVWKQTYTLPSNKSLRDARISTEMYGEVMKNLEIADFTLKNKTPFISKVDIPRVPLENAKNSMVKQIIIGLFLGTFLSAFYIIIRRVVKISMM
ncbi:MAG TPA: hypothetical protein DIS94_11575 [Bacteroidetes bacterium]|nr:hypothetical protein [Bacteroidota bacterium]